jgi:hypothetical protein
VRTLPHEVYMLCRAQDDRWVSHDLPKFALTFSGSSFQKRNGKNMPGDTVSCIIGEVARSKRH